MSEARTCGGFPIPPINTKGETMAGPSLETQNVKICVVGNNDIAKAFAARLCRGEHLVARMPERPAFPADMCNHYNLMVAYKPHIIVFAVPTRFFREALTLFPASLYSDVIVMSYLPVMTQARNIMLEFLPKSAGIILGGLIVGDWDEKRLLIDLHRITKGIMYERASVILRLLRRNNCILSLTSAEEYDESMVQAAFIPSAIRRIYNELEFCPADCNAECSEPLLEMVDGDWLMPHEIFYTLFRYNPFARKAFKGVGDSLRTTYEKLEESEQEEISVNRQEDPADWIASMNLSP